MSTLLDQVSVNGTIIQVLINEFGPILAQIIINWLTKHPPVSASVGESITSSVLRHYIASLLKQHEAEILAQVNAQMKTLFDEGIAALDA